MSSGNSWKAGFSLLAAISFLCVTLQGSRASAVDLAGTGKSFANALADEAAACKSKLTAINAESLKAVFGCLLGAVKNAARGALLAMARGLYDDAIHLLKDKAPLAKQKLAELSGKITAVVPQAKQLLQPVIAGIVGAGGDALVAEAGKCREKIVALDVASLKATFTCLLAAVKSAGKTALVAIAQGLFDAFINQLRTGCAAATKKLEEFANKVVAVVPIARSLVGPAVSAIRSGCSGAVDKAAVSVKLPR